MVLALWIHSEFAQNAPVHYFYDDLGDGIINYREAFGFAG
jgi:hypothetical protein